jgi:hypothetical protein
MTAVCQVTNCSYSSKEDMETKKQKQKILINEF